jgi:hypothetical protein
MKAYGEVNIQIHIFLASALSGRLHAPVALPPGKELPNTHSVEGWVNPRAGWDSVEKRKFLTLPGLELRPPLSSNL